ncbi:MAG TPA: AI-2E family transporter [Pseudonocardiaceae bacterium]|jgi:predicted PurR-regulated permease PerM
MPVTTHGDDDPESSREADGAEPADGHHNLIAQPHSDTEGPIAEAEAGAAQIRTTQNPLGEPGEPLDRKSPLIIGLTAAAGVAITAGLVAMIVSISDELVLIGLSLFLAIGMEPAVSLLARRWMPRWAAVTVVCVGLVVAVGGFLAVALSPLIEQASGFIRQVPRYLQSVQDHSSLIGRLNDRFHLQQSVEQSLNTDQLSFAQTVLGAGVAVVGGVVDTLIVLVLTVYFLAAMPQLRNGLYRLVPRSRRPRVILLGDAIFVRFGGYVLGNLVISLITGIGTYIWLLIFGVPFPLALAILVALLDLIPVVGSTVAGVLVSLVALTVSVPVAIATAGFYVAYRFIEDYLLFPKIFGKVLRVPGVVTVLALLIGGGLGGIIGALVALPIAAAVLLVVQEVAFPRLDHM